MPQYVQLSLYPDPDEHFAYVAMWELEGAVGGLCYCVRCPAADCDRGDGALYERFDTAYEAALTHRKANLPEWLLEGMPEG